MKKIISFIAVLFVFLSMQASAFAQESLYNLPISPIPCNKLDPTLSCPTDFIAPGGIYDNLDETCAESYDKFLENPVQSHYWVEDPAITAQGKANERARQFIYWVINTDAIDEAVVLRSVWNISSMIAFFGVVIIAAIFGLGFIISRRTNFDFKVRIAPTVTKIGFMLLYIALSAALIFILIQFSEILMKFFIDNLGGGQLFNIYFSNSDPDLLGRTEQNYTQFIGCRDLNIRVQEGVDTELFMLKLTNVTYYIMGIMLLLRKILLWFLLFVSPFLALLMPFMLIRNIGWIWIGVFFQWLFYGPLFALFLGALAKIWGEGIPFNFDFSRVRDMGGYVYPTGINILYGGPAQLTVAGRQLSALNNANYVDTFAEYIITLLMLWAVTFFPWWLLRIFRDYCCDGIYAMKNILMAMYDSSRGGPPNGPSPIKPPTLPSLNINTPTNTNTQQNVTVSMSSLEQIRKTLTTDITKSLELKATRLTEVARMETNKTTQSAVVKNLAMISNPATAQVPAQRQMYMNLRSELFNRAIKNDTIARTILASTSTSQTEKVRIRQEILKTIPQLQSINQIVTKSTSIPQQTVSSITNNYITNVANNTETVQQIAKSSNTTNEAVKNILNSYAKYTSQPITQIIKTISKDANTTEKVVRDVLSQTRSIVSTSKVVNTTANVQKLTTEQVTRILDGVRNSFSTINQTSVKQTTNAPAVTNTNQSTNINAPVVMNTNRQTNETVSNQTTTQQTQSTQQTSAPVQVQTSQDSFIKVISFKANVAQDKAQSIVQNVMTSASNNKTLISNIEKQTGLAPQQIKTVITTYSQNINKPQATMIESIHQSAGIARDKVQSVLQSTTDTIMSAHDVVQDVAQLEGVSVEQIDKVMDTQMDVASAPEQHIEESIPIPQSISLEDYEEVKDMWTKQYEEGEVPVSESIQNRTEWIDQESVFITNTLNKILSSDEKLRQEGLDDVGYLLPIFLINNLKGDELIVYLKAKLEAAKDVKKLMEHEEKVKAKIKEEELNDEDNLVEVNRTQQEENTMHLEVDNEEHLGGIEERVAAAEAKLASVTEEPVELPEEAPVETTPETLKEFGDQAEEAPAELKEMSDEEPADPSLEALKNKLRESADNDNIS
ncbi:MAG: hypothetical protein ACEQSA_05310 [Weeksellaceae bacterium]